VHSYGSFKILLRVYSFVLNLPENGTPVPKRVRVLINVINCSLLSAFVRGYIDFKNMKSMNNITLQHIVQPYHGEK
jgi:hypothetical protein